MKSLSKMPGFCQWFMAAVVFTSVPLYAEEGGTAASPEIFARVNGKPITRAEVDEQIQNIVAQFQGQLPPEEAESIRKNIEESVIEQLVITLVLGQLVEAENIQVEEAEVEEAIADIRGQIPPGTTLDQQLEMMGMSMGEMREEIKSNRAIEKLLKMKTADQVEVTEEEIAGFYEGHKALYFTRSESVRASHILLGTRDAADEEAKQAVREKLEQIRAAILEGADFAGQAREHSSCPSGAEGGGLGEFARGQMVPAFEEAAFTQEVGKVGPVIETQFGYHIVLVTDRLEAGEISLEETREDIARHLGEQKREQAVRKYIRELRENAEVEILPAP